MSKIFPMNKQTRSIPSIHCASCKIMIEDIITENSPLSWEVNVRSRTLTYWHDGDIDIEEEMAKITPLLQEYGYHFGEENWDKIRSEDNLWLALLIGLLGLALFLILQKSDILDFSLWEMSLGTSFIIGLMASVSSCLAVVGWLILSLSAEEAYENKRWAYFSATLFHLGRLGGFFLLGWLLGMLGNAIGINYIFSGILWILAALVMIILGLHLMKILPQALTLPANFFRSFQKLKGNIFGPLLIGLGTFFLPCGFTQAMQINALQSGNFLQGALIMLLFALWTFPILAGLSFGTIKIAQSKISPVFFQSIGVFVVGLGLFSFITALVGLGILPPFFSL